MPYTARQSFTESILNTMYDELQKIDKQFARGFITDAEQIELKSAIIQKTAEMLQAL